MNFTQGELIAIDKPYRMSSFGALAHVRYLVSKKIGVKRVKMGHAGTLDPLATGVLVLCTGKTTKQIETWQQHSKEYVATLQLGATTASFDREHTVDFTYPTRHITKNLVMETLQQFEGDPKKAFTGKNSLEKNHVWLDEMHTHKVPGKVKLISFESVYTIRKEVSPDLKIDKVIDVHIRQILQARLDEFGGDAKRAFTNLDDNPIWLNKEKGIAIKRVTISGISNAESLHDKRD